MPVVHLVRLGPDGPVDGVPPRVIRDFPCVIGRKSTCDCILDDQLISRRHCQLSLRDGQVWVEDLVSRNGTHLNGLFLADPRPLQDGDRLELAHLSFRIRVRPTEEAAAACDSGAGRQVLVVEDDDFTARTLALLLRSWGHQVRVARDGPEALEAARAQPPEVVFLDINLPTMSGLEVARRLQAEDALRRTRLVAITGDEGATQVLQAPQQFAQLLVKPVSATVLREALAATA
jgi:CheY-like chemotaxis protein